MDILAPVKKLVEKFQEKSAEARAAQEEWNTKADAYVKEHGLVAFEKAMDRKPG